MPRPITAPAAKSSSKTRTLDSNGQAEPKPISRKTLQPTATSETPAAQPADASRHSSYRNQVKSAEPRPILRSADVRKAQFAEYNHVGPNP